MSKEKGYDVEMGLKDGVGRVLAPRKHSPYAIRERVSLGEN